MDEKMAALKRLQEIVEILRGPEGCPWDRAQKLENMGQYLLEEATEAVDAMEESAGKPTARVSEELGDLLMNIFLSAKIAEDEGAFDLADVAHGVAEKLVRRHPHVFGKVLVNGVEDVLANWNVIKAEEKKAVGGSSARPSRLDGVPRALPPLERAFELGKKAAKAGFDWPGPEGALEKVSEELGEVRSLLRVSGAVDKETRKRLEEELGDLLFALVSLCRKLDIAPSSALRRTLNKFCERFRAIEDRFPKLEEATLEEMEAAWQEAKAPPSEGDTPSPRPLDEKRRTWPIQGGPEAST